MKNYQEDQYRKNLADRARGAAQAWERYPSIVELLEELARAVEIADCDDKDAGPSVGDCWCDDCTGGTYGGCK